MPRFAANLNWMFQEWALADRFQAAADAGFTAVEVLNPYELPPDAIAEPYCSVSLLKLCSSDD